MVKKFPNTQKIADAEKIFAHELAPILGKSKTRLAVLSACNSGFWQVVKPFLDAGLPAIIGVNGGVASISTIEFCTKLYESLAVGLTLDEAISRARLHVLEWGRQYKLFDWGLFMVYMPSPQSVIFPRIANTAILTTQKKVRQENNIAISSSLQLVKELDGLNFGEIMSELIKHRVLILGRFTGRRLKILKAIQEHLAKHKNRYIPELFTFSRPDERDLIEAITGFAALSRFIIADLSEPKSLPAELEAIVPHFLSIPIVPVINKSGKPYATFTSIQRRENVIELIRYADLKNLLNMIDEKIVGIAENKLAELKPQ